jgi:hypothetical protein
MSNNSRSPILSSQKEKKDKNYYIELVLFSVLEFG